MKKPNFLLVVSSLMVGSILTILFLGQMNWRTFENSCQVPASTAKTEGCAIMEYGYPKRWVTSDVNVGEQNVVFATTSFNPTNLVYDWVVLSVVSFIVLYVLSLGLKTRTPRKNTSKTKQ